MDRLERLVNLVAALIDAERPLTRQELRERVGGYSADPEAFRRNFERDKDVLRQMGMPLVTETLGDDRADDQAGYRIPRDRYELADPGLSGAELAALRLAASAVRLDADWGSEATVSALRKLAAAGGAADGGAADGGAADGGAADGGERPGPVAPPTPGLAELAGGEAVAAAFGAIAERRRLRFAYRGEARLVDPWRLSYRRGQWYLSGWDHLRDGERVYRLDRVDGAVEPTGDPDAFERPGGGAAAPVPAWRLGDGPEVAVTVRIDADQAPWAAASVGTEAVTARGADGSVDVELRVTNQDALRSWVLGFLHHAEIVDPPELRAAMRSWLEALAGERVVTRAPAHDRLGRLLAIVPWVASQDGPAVRDVCERFGVGEEELLADLDLLFLCGVHPFTPDTLIEVDVADGRVWIRFADYFRRPLRLTAPEGLALVSAGSTLLGMPGGDLDGALASALAKLEATLGITADDAVEVELGAVPAAVLGAVRSATDSGRKVRIDYYSFGRDRRRTRVVQPWRVFAAAGQWYLSGWCELAAGERLFRLDRVHSAEVLEARTDRPAPADAAQRLFHPDPAAPTVVLDLDRSARWIAEQYPTEAAVARPDGRLRVTLRVGEEAWLDRVLLRAGPAVTVVEGTTTVAAAARRILRNYRDGP